MAAVRHRKERIRRRDWQLETAALDPTATSADGDSLYRTRNILWGAEGARRQRKATVGVGRGRKATAIADWAAQNETWIHNIHFIFNCCYYTAPFSLQHTFILCTFSTSSFQWLPAISRHLVLLIMQDVIPDNFLPQNGAKISTGTGQSLSLILNNIFKFLFKKYFLYY